MEPVDTRQIERRIEEPRRRETSAHRFARSLVSGTLSRASVAGSETILGSFPSFEQHFITGSNENYCIHDGYCPWEAPQSFDDTPNEGEWQLEVNQSARDAQWFHIENHLISCAAQGTQCLLCTR